MNVDALFPRPPRDLRYTFDGFVVGERSRVAFEAAMAVAETPARLHNPLVLWGASGSGKSHLVYAIVGAAAPRVVVRVTGADLVRRLLDAIRFDQMHELECVLSHVDMLLVDDFPRGRRRRNTARAILKLLDLALARGVQVVVTTHMRERHVRLVERRIRVRHPRALFASTGDRRLTPPSFPSPPAPA